MSWFFSSGKILYQDKLKSLLNEISALSPEEREYVKAVFSRYASNGISREEAEKAIRQMKLNFSDNIDSQELQRIKEKILGFFG
jgi:hypothetical protein